MATTERMLTRPKDRPEEGVRWIPSACGICYSQCSILMKVKNGVLVKIEGDPKSPVGRGNLCPKGVSAIMTVYDPHRVNVPLMRTNPEKGIGVDPQWKEITWEEANQIIVEKLKRIRADNPHKLSLVRTTTCPSTRNSIPWISAFGSPNMWTAGGGLHCGNAAHLLGGQFHSSWSLVPDYSLCEYAIHFGASKGHSAGHVANSNAGLASDARVRGMKMVVVDPMSHFAGAKSSEWVPIRVGTDAALALGMVNIILNEMGIWDAPYLKRHTNGVYLVGPDGLLVRDKDTEKPLIWDETAGRARTYDDPELGDPALLGEYEVNGVRCHPGFQLIKEHVKKYTLDKVEEITTVPAEQTRHLAHEFATRARVGATIELDGHVLPYRPVAAIFFRGVQGHKNSTYNCLAVEMLNQIVGASDVPGGALGFNPCMHGHPETGKPYYEPYAGPDGMMMVGAWLAMHKPYPPHDPKSGSTVTMSDAWPLTMLTGMMVAKDRHEIWEALGVDYRVEMLLNIGANPVLTVGNPQTAVEALKEIPFIVSFELTITEFSELADIVLPDASGYERWDCSPQYPPIYQHPAGPGEWGWPTRQPAFERVGQRRDFQEVLLDWAHECGFGEEHNAMLNRWYELSGEYALQSGQKYDWLDIANRRLESVFGPEHGLEWFKEHGVMTWPKTVKEVYWRHFVDARVPLYYATMKQVGIKQKALFEQHNFAHKLNWAQFEPLPEWTPCASHLEKREGFDFYAFYYRDVLTSNSFTYENPWLDEVALANPYSFNIAVNRSVATAKGLKSGDWVIVESPYGRTVRGRLITSEAVHPEALAVAGCGGHYTTGQPIAFGKGIRFNELLEIDLDHSDPVSLSMDCCVKVKVTRDPHQGPAAGMPT